MEARRLMAGDLAAIAGNVFTDLTDNGYDPHNPPAIIGDPGLAGVTVNLYQDDGNGTFGAEDGAAIMTDVTDANGNYRFDGLTSEVAGPRLYFVQQEPATGRLQRATETVKSVSITPAQSTGVETLNIDDYNTTPVSTTPAPLSAAPSSTVNDQQATAAGEALGGQRDIQVNNTTAVGPGATNLDVTVDSGLLSISPGPGVTGNVIVSYDGVDASAATLDHTTLGPINLTASNGEAFHFLVGSEAGNSLTITVYSGNGDFSSTTVPLVVTAGGVATEDLIIPFADIDTNTGGGADFTAVTAIRFQVDVAAGSDAQVNFTRVVGPDVTDVNFANLNPMSVGNLVFRDSNNNGVLDGTETGISGVRVELYEDTNLNGVFDTGIDTAVGTAQTTDASGNYVFDNLFPGEYIALIPDSQFAAGEALFGFLTSDGNDPAPDPDVNVTDNDDNGALIVGVGVATAAVTLAAGSEPTNDGDTDPNSNLTVDFGFAPQIDLAVSKTASVASVPAGSQITYTISVSNEGLATATDVLVVDDLPNLAPTDLTIVSATSTGGGTVTEPLNVNGEIEVAFASLAPSQTETITIVVLVPATAATSAQETNSVSVTGEGIDTDPTNNSDSADVAITRQASLTLTKTDSPDPNQVGGTLTYEIVVTNTGPSTANNVVVTDTLPAGLTLDGTPTSTLGTVTLPGGVITTTIPTLNVNESATITVVTTIDNGFAGTTIPNSASAVADEATTVTANAETDINPDLDLQITKTDSVDPVNRGQQLTYTLVVTNAGPSPATNVEVVDNLPDGLQIVSANSTVGTVTIPASAEDTTAANPDDLTVAIGNLASGATATITVLANVLQSTAASITNTASVTSTETVAGFDRDTTNNTVSEPTATAGVIDLAITKTDSIDPAIPGESLTYTLVVTNEGPSDATLVNVSDNLPDGLQITSAISSKGTVSIPASAQDTTPANPDNLLVNIGDLSTIETVTITIVATVLPGTTGTLTNTATVATTATNVTETVTANNTASADTALTPEIDLQVTKTDSADPAIAGNPLTYTITVTNNGPSTATNVVVTDTLPISDVSFTSASSSQGPNPTQAGGVVTAQIGTLAPSASATVTIIVGVDSDTRGTINNTASATASQTDTNTQNNQDTEPTLINGSVDLAITKTDSVDPVAAGGSLTYTIVVTNNGPSDATGVNVTDNLPDGLRITSASSTVGSVTIPPSAQDTNPANNDDLTVNIGNLADGGTATITVVAEVLTGTTGTLTNTASVAATETESNNGNNTATQQTTLAVPGSISGFVYMDINRNGIRDAGDMGIEGVMLQLTGMDMANNNISRDTLTNADGEYSFDNLLPGTYQIVQTQPPGLQSGETNIGTGATGATAGVNQISTIQLGSGANAQAFNFGEFRSALSKRRFLASSDPAA